MRLTRPTIRPTGALRRAATADLFPDVSRRVRRAVATPLGVLLAAAAVAGLCGLAVHPRVFALAGGLVGVAAAGVCWPWLTARGVRAGVRFDRDRCSEGEAVGVHVIVTNHLPWPAVGLVVRGGFGGDARIARLPAIPARSRVAAKWAFAPDRRGEYPLAAPRLSTGFPFGVWEAGRAAAVSGRLVVWPRTVPVGPVPAAAADEASEGTVARNRAGGQGELVGVRPYRRGDSPRRVHWGQTAKHDRLVVCELQAAARPVVLLVLDADPGVHTGGPDGSREWAVRVVASLAKGWLEQGAVVGAAWDGAVVPPAAGAAQAVRILDALARLPDAGRRPVRDVLADPAVRRVRAAVRVAVTTDAGAAPPVDGVRWVVLRRAGFGGPPPAGGCDEGPPRPRVRPWVEVPGPDRVADLLRHGWAEAKHGS